MKYLTLNVPKIMKPSNEKLIKTLEDLKATFKVSDKQRQILERCQKELINYDSQRPQIVLKAIREGQWTIHDISIFTTIPYRSVHQIISQLLTQGKIKKTVFKDSERRGPSKQIFQIKD